MCNCGKDTKPDLRGRRMVGAYCETCPGGLKDLHGRVYRVDLGYVYVPYYLAKIWQDAGKQVRINDEN